MYKSLVCGCLHVMTVTSDTELQIKCSYTGTLPHEPMLSP